MKFIYIHTPTDPSYKDYFNLVKLAVLEVMRFLTLCYIPGDCMYAGRHFVTFVNGSSSPNKSVP